MWVLTRDSFVSVVRHRDRPSYLLVRARRADDITTIWPDADVLETPDADYGFRAAVKAQAVAAAFAAMAENIDYETDFKGGVRDKRRHDAYLSVWTALRRLK